MYTTKTPEILKALASDLTWNKSREEKCVYLTFDDGPAAGVTDKILDILHQFSAKATFFCVGEMVEKNPELLHRIKEEGHALGNHTYKHESGWKTENAAYFRSYLACHDLVDSKLFRPPYGRISKSQAKLIKKRSEINNFIKKAKPYGLASITRSGPLAMSKGSETIKDNKGKIL